MLEVRGLAVSYGRHRALEGVSVKVDRGEICVILGANGAGKSTLLKAIAGMVKAEPGGEIAVNGRSIRALKPHKIVERGIALVPEGRGIFGELTVAENLQLGAFAGRARGGESERLDTVYGLFPRLADRRKQIARTMSGGEQQMVAIGRALMSNPEILMLDEPSLGLSPLLTKELFRSLTAIAATGVGILLVEQNAKQSLKIAGRGYLIENGHVTGENSAQALISDPAVINAYLGGTAAHPAHPLVTMPPPMRLPFDFMSISSLAGELARRASRVQAAFIRSLRQTGDVPSAFVGRYDPMALPEPTDEPAPSFKVSGHSFKVSNEARLLGGNAAAFAARASERLASHIKTERLSTPTPSAFVRAAAVNVEPKQFMPSATVESERAASDAVDLERLNGSHGLIGHNSAGLDIEGDETGPTAEPIAASSPADDAFASLAARAAAIQAAYVSARRKGLKSFTIPAAQPAAETTQSPAEDGRNRSKEA